MYSGLTTERTVAVVSWGALSRLVSSLVFTLSDPSQDVYRERVRALLVVSLNIDLWGLRRTSEFGMQIGTKLQIGGK
ncbi:hypothetical protein F4819DRAFT_440504 [Hypoxylon fuscum]|nr:hypothetical protein F4819DRAFT_440504 [Hypoxylon fuscum]